METEFRTCFKTAWIRRGRVTGWQLMEDDHEELSHFFLAYGWEWE